MGTDHIQPLCAQESKPQDRFQMWDGEKFNWNVLSSFATNSKNAAFFSFFLPFIFFPLLLLVLREIRDIKQGRKRKWGRGKWDVAEEVAVHKHPEATQGSRSRTQVPKSLWRRCCYLRAHPLLCKILSWTKQHMNLLKYSNLV